MNRPRILVVEDDFLIRLTLTEALSDDGFDVLEAGSAAEALVHLESTADIQLMMTDISLPGEMDGGQLATRVRSARPNLPMIFMTGKPAEAAYTSPQDLYVAKPYLPSEICAAARRMTQTTFQGA